MSPKEYLESLPKCKKCEDIADDPKNSDLCFCCRNPLSYAAIQKANNQLQQELDAARDDIQFLKLEIDSNKIVIKSQQEAEENLKRWLAETEQQLAEAKTQIAYYVKIVDDFLNSDDDKNSLYWKNKLNKWKAK